MQRSKAMSLWPVALRMSPFIFACLCILHTDAPPSRKPPFIERRRGNVNCWPADSAELSALGDWGEGGEEDRREGGSECGWGASGLERRGARWSSRCWSWERNNCLTLVNLLPRAEEVVWGGGGRVEGGQSYSRGWLRSLYLQRYLGSTTYLSSSHLRFLLLFFLLQVIFKPLFVCLSLSYLATNHWYPQCLWMLTFPNYTDTVLLRPRHVICAA